MKTLRYTLYIFAGVLAFSILYLASAYILGHLSTHPKKKCPRPDQRVYVHSSGVHIEIIFPDSLLPEALRKDLVHDRKDAFTSFGWGEKAFYTKAKYWDSLKLSTALAAAFLPTPALLRVRGYLKAAPEWHSLVLCREQVDSLFQHISETFVTGNNGNKKRYRNFHYGPSDYFYEAKGKYSLFNTCNTWANKAFKRASIPTALWTPFENGIIRHLPKNPEPSLRAGP